MCVCVCVCVCVSQYISPSQQAETNLHVRAREEEQLVPQGIDDCRGRYLVCVEVAAKSFEDEEAAQLVARDVLRVCVCMFVC